MSEIETGSEIKLLGAQTFKSNDEMYKVVDFLNKTLKERDLIFGLSKNEDGNLVISIYKS